MTSIVTPTGIFPSDKWNSTVAIPETPPGAILYGIRKRFIAKARIIDPNNIWSNESVCFIILFTNPPHHCFERIYPSF
jgi:hypothetical protein